MSEITQKVAVSYRHDPADHRTVHLAVSVGEPRERDWKPAFCDHMLDRRRKRQPVVWARFPAERRGQVWVRDADGMRKVRPLG